MDTKWQFGQLLENVQSRQPFHRTFLLHPKKPLLRRLFRMFTKPDRRPPSPSPLLWRNPLFDPPFFPSLSKSPSSIPAFFPRNRRRCSSSFFVRQSQSPKKIAKIFLRRRRRRRRFALSFRRHSQFLSAAASVLRGGLARSPRWSRSARITKLVEAAASARPTVRPSTARRYHTPPLRRRRRNGPILDGDRVPV